MVRGYFGGGNRGTFCSFVVKSVNARVCLKLLEYLALPVMQRVSDTVGDTVFQQDNAPVHTASVVTDIFWWSSSNSPTNSTQTSLTPPAVLML